MEITTTTTNETPRRQAAVNALAIVGFLVLIIIGIVLAIYAARYLPNALNGSASAITSIFKSGDGQNPDLNVITSTSTVPFEPIASTTVPFDETVTKSSDTDTSPKDTNVTKSGSKSTTTKTTTVTRRVPVTVPAPAPYGKGDLAVRITAVGYCTSDNPDSFRTSDTVTGTKNGGVQFAIKNLGTNVISRWDFSYKVPSDLSEQTERDQHGLNPGDEIDYTLCFEKPKVGDNRQIRIEADPNDRVDESNEGNNVATATVDITRR